MRFHDRIDDSLLATNLSIMSFHAAAVGRLHRHTGRVAHHLTPVYSVGWILHPVSSMLAAVPAATHAAPQHQHLHHDYTSLYTATAPASSLQSMQFLPSTPAERRRGRRGMAGCWETHH